MEKALGNVDAIVGIDPDEVSIGCSMMSLGPRQSVWPNNLSHLLVLVRNEVRGGGQPLS